MRLGNHNEMMGKATRMQSLTTSATMNGSTPWNTVRVGTCGNSALMTNRFIPTGGLISPISTTTTIKIPNQIGSRPRCTTSGKNTGTGNPRNSTHARGVAADVILAGPGAYQVVEAGRKAWSEALWKTAIS